MKLHKDCAFPKIKDAVSHLADALEATHFQVNSFSQWSQSNKVGKGDYNLKGTDMQSHQKNEEDNTPQK